jgi:hypothetical protein
VFAKEADTVKQEIERKNKSRNSYTIVSENQNLLRIPEIKLMGMAYRYRLTPRLINWRNNPTSINKILPGHSLLFLQEEKKLN